MRHLKNGNRLGVDSSHRKALMRNLLTALFENGRIKTTLAKAKALRPDAEKLITLSKKRSLHARRLALKQIQTKNAFINLFDKYADLYKERNGGYTRIYKIGNRLGDNAKMALIELVDYTKTSSEDVVQSGSKAKQSKVISEVKEDIST